MWPICKGDSLSNVVETASASYKHQEHFSPVGLKIAPDVRDRFQRFDFGITAQGKAVAYPVFKVIQLRVSPALKNVTLPCQPSIICGSEVEYEIVQILAASAWLSCW